ncbi:hypothetical protein PsorP6_008259 [Peronosclerospora sorghi]|uniref:Uncharacterized protein n=1 Tax=Peronosclerospora sorghi TaxID=230839 RepID=A0ACC0W6V5_9STRA|nr:hypothetical protein PsorP6_008259 [Peronosclerospora sorghi]
MDKYRRVEKPRRDEQTMQVEPNEIRITQQGKEKNERFVVLKAMGNAISKAVTVAEILKHRVAKLHMVTRISSIETVDVYDPLEEGLDRIETKRKIPSISIQLSLDELDRDDPGYQSPIPADQVSSSSPSYHDSQEFRKPRGRRRHSGRNSGRGGKSEAATEAVETVDVEDDQKTPCGEGEGASTPTTRGKRGKGRSRKRSGSNGRRGKKDSGRASPDEADDNAAASSATEQQAEGEGQPTNVKSRKSGRGRKEKKIPSNDNAEKEGGEEGEDGAREDEQVNGRGGKGKYFGRSRAQGRSRKRGESNRREGNSGSPTITTDSATVDANGQ